MLVSQGFMEKIGPNKGGFKFKNLEDIMEDGVKAPKNILHVF